MYFGISITIFFQIKNFVVTCYCINVNISILDYETVCEWEDFSPRCGAGQVVVMESALYGRMRPARCIGKNN